MKQIQMAEYGSVDVLKQNETEIPVPQKGEILIKVNAVGVNYSDLLRRQNTYHMPTPLPFVLGTEAVGTVSKLGKDVLENQFPLGSKVLAILPDGGGYSEYVNASAQYCVLLPNEMDETEATAIFVQGTTAHLLMHEIAKEVNGKTMLVHASTGGVGSLLVQLGKLAGAKVVAASSSDEKLKMAKEIGADILINYTKNGWVDELLKVNNHEKVDLIFDGVGGKIFQESIKALKPNGQMIVYGASSGSLAMVHGGQIIEQNLNVQGFNLGHYIQNKMDVWQASLGTIIELIATKRILVHVPNKYPL